MRQRLLLITIPLVIQFFCTGCGKGIGLAQRPVGGQAQCPFCNAVVPVPVAVAAAFGSQFPSATPYWSGNLLVVPRGSQLPPTTCLVCARQGEATPRSRKYTWVPPYVYIGLFAGLIPVIILTLILQKTEHVQVPTCSRCASRWSLSVWLFPLAILVGLFALPAAFAVVGNRMAHDTGVGFGVLLGFLAWITGVILGRILWVDKVQVVCKRIDEQGVHLKTPGAQALQAASVNAI